MAASTRSSSRRAANTASATWAGSAAVVRARAIACMRCAVSAATRRRRSFLVSDRAVHSWTLRWPRRYEIHIATAVAASWVTTRSVWLSSP